MTRDAEINSDTSGGSAPAGSVSPGQGRQRDFAEVYQRMAHQERIAEEELGLSRTPTPTGRRGRGDGTDGLLLRALTEDRWKVAPQTAKAKLAAADLPVEGRRQNIVYSWPSILRAEGVPQETAKVATRETHPELFDDLLTPEEAAMAIGVKSDATIRKLVLGGKIGPQAFITFGTRGIRRFRPGGLKAQRLARLEGRLV